MERSHGSRFEPRHVAAAPELRARSSTRPARHPTMIHHERAVRGAIDRYSEADGARGLILGGSVARGTERPDSDVDLTLVVSDDAYPQYAASDRLSFVDHVPEYYEHAYFDVKVVTKAILARAVERADDPMRASFVDARVLWTAADLPIDALDAQLHAIAEPNDATWLEHEASFMAQARLHARYFLDQAEQLDLGLLRHHAAVHFAFAIGRALLARNHVLFSGPKYLETELGRLEIAPVDVAPRLRRFLDAPTLAVAIELLSEVEELGGWSPTQQQTLSRFVEDNELAWLTGRIPPEYR